MKEMRLLLTQDCNYDCAMCHGEGLQTEKETTLSPEDFAFIFRVGKEQFGMDTTSLTGGEPLFRKDVVEIARQLHQEGAKITLTTNGRLLSSRLEIGKYLDKVNVSIHTMDEVKYEKLVRVKGSFHKALESVKAFRASYPDLPIVINTTCINGFNAEPENFAALIEFAKSINASIKVIELFPRDRPDTVKLEDIRELLDGLGFVDTSKELRKIRLSDGQTNIALARIFCSEAIQNGDPAGFCNTNNDLFVSPDGQAKPCRSDMMEIDFNPALKSRNEQDMVDIIRQAFSRIGSRCIYK